MCDGAWFHKKMNFIEFDFYLIVPKIVGMPSIEKLGVGGSDIFFFDKQHSHVKKYLDRILFYNTIS